MSRTTCLLAVLLMSASAVSAQTAPQYSVEDIQKSFGTSADTNAPAAAEAPGVGDPDEPARRGVRTGRTRTFSIYSGQSGAPASQSASPNKPKLVTVGPRPAPAAAIPTVHRDLLITFANDSTELTDQAKANARVFAKALNTPVLQGASFAIEGHTNQVGNRDYNVDLSRRRAAAVADFLADNGVDRSRIEVRGFGFDQLANPSDPRGAENRRVEARRLK